MLPIYMNKRRSYNYIAGFYDLLDLPFEYGRYQSIRRRLFENVSGEILDVGVGTGRNMPFYPSGNQVTGIDLSPQMLIRAEKRKTRKSIAVELHQMNVMETTFPDGHFDYVIASFLFCVLIYRFHLSFPFNFSYQ